MIRIALDAMGGDGGVEPVVAGAARFSTETGDVRVLLCGDPGAIQAVLDREPHDRSRLAILPARTCVPMSAKAVEALDSLDTPSVAVAAAAVAAGEADALVSAGHTAATILAASRSLPRLPGVRRAALAAVYPTQTRRGPHEDPFALLLDVGATLSCSAEDLVTFAVMGSAYARLITEVARPRVALLSNGTEPNRGTPAIVEAHALLRTHPSVNFLGNVEGLDIPKGTADVVVCEGFLGNVVLKMFEGMAETLVGLVREAAEERVLWKVGLSLVGQDLRELKRLTDWKQYGGAPLLGLSKPVIKAHGRSNARAMRNALKVAAKAARSDLVGQIATAIEAGSLPGR